MHHSARGTVHEPYHFSSSFTRRQTCQNPHNWYCYEEMKLGLDRFYDTPANGPVSISGALQVIAARGKGASEDVVQKFIVELRAAASKL